MGVIPPSEVFLGVQPKYNLFLIFLRWPRPSCSTAVVRSGPSKLSQEFSFRLMEIL